MERAYECPNRENLHLLCEWLLAPAAALLSAYPWHALEPIAFGERSNLVHITCRHSLDSALQERDKDVMLSQLKLHLLPFQTVLASVSSCLGAAIVFRSE
ncbi:hypothetical protein J3F83DRAFT_720453 [Trichoderma novae-zelandiae]